MSEQLSFTDIEANICTIAGMIEEDKLYFAQMAGAPLMAILLAKHSRTPNVGYVVEEGAVAPNPSFPLPRMMLGASRSHYRAVAWYGMNVVDAHAALGFMDYGLLACLQVDRFGNFNSTHIGGTYEQPERRFGGAGGANEIASQCWRTLLMTKLEKRKFVNKLDFMSSPGYLDGTPGARERAGLPANTGPFKVITQEAMFDFDEETRQMRLTAMMPWTSVEQVLSKMEFEPLIADKIERMEPPTDEELNVIRTLLDPGGLAVSRGEWITIDAATGQRAA
ncbi:MAG: CoA-transferase [Dehalococcoidia bacterium]|nr:CoA-transferase [Dehalococcoidia bacterium]